jgi:hypothetical protein
MIKANAHQKFTRDSSKMMYKTVDNQNRSKSAFNQKGNDKIQTQKST